MESSSRESSPTRGQLQRQLEQQVQQLFRQQLGHQSGKISCQIFNDKVTLIIEDAVTKPEQLLVEQGDRGLVQQFHADLETAMRPQLQSLVETTLRCRVVDVMSDTTLETGRTGYILMLSEVPETRKSVRSSAAVST